MKMPKVENTTVTVFCDFVFSTSCPLQCLRTIIFRPEILCFLTIGQHFFPIKGVIILFTFYIRYTKNREKLSPNTVDTEQKLDFVVSDLYVYTVQTVLVFVFWTSGLNGFYIYRKKPKHLQKKKKQLFSINNSIENSIAKMCASLNSVASEVYQLCYSKSYHPHSTFIMNCTDEVEVYFFCKCWSVGRSYSTQFPLNNSCTT